MSKIFRIQLPKKICPFCGHSFIPRQSRQITCGGRYCKQELKNQTSRNAYRNRQKHDPIFIEKRREAVRKCYWNKREGIAPQIFSATCEICGKQFTYIKTRGDKHVCSQECYEERQRRFGRLHSKRRTLLRRENPALRKEYNKKALEYYRRRKERAKAFGATILP
jgi:hypothetical protein